MSCSICPSGRPRSCAMTEAAARLAGRLKEVAAAFDLTVEIVLTDGTQPVGRGIGPALEARDVLAVLQNEPGSPHDLRSRALTLAGHLLELAGRRPLAAECGWLKTSLQQALHGGSFRAFVRRKAACEIWLRRRIGTISRLCVMAGSSQFTTANLRRSQSLPVHHGLRLQVSIFMRPLERECRADSRSSPSMPRRRANSPIPWPMPRPMPTLFRSVKANEHSCLCHARKRRPCTCSCRDDRCGTRQT